MARYHYPLPLGGRQNYGILGENHGVPGVPHFQTYRSGKHQTSNVCRWLPCWNMVIIDDCIMLCWIEPVSAALKQRTPKQKHHGFWAECFDQDKLTKLCESHRVSMHDLFTLMVPAATARDVLPLFSWLDKHCRR